MCLIICIAGIFILMFIFLYFLTEHEDKSASIKTKESFPISLRLVRGPNLLPKALRILESVCRRINIRVNYKIFNETVTFVDGRVEDGENVIYVYFETPGNHRGHSEFDGPRGTLAHALMDGDELCFDTSEEWGDTFLGNVAVHELLHNLGVAHNNRKDSVMNSKYRGLSTLGDSDVEELYKLFPFMKT